jgi:uncharacterized protein (DUF2164 family)
MAIELTREARDEAVASIKKYFEENMGEPVGDLAAGGLLNFFLEEVGPAVYNRGVADAQQRLQERLSELDAEVHEEEFQYWRRRGRAGKHRR